MHHDAKLEAAIRANPDDDASFLVYGDWLLEQGDVVGQLVRIHSELAARPQDADLLAREAELVQGNVEALFGPAQAFAGEAAPRARRDEVDSALPWPNGYWAYGHTRIQWHHGFMRRVLFDTEWYCNEDDSQGSAEAAEVLRRFLAHPTAAFIREIALGDVWCTDGGPDLGPCLVAIAESPCAATLTAVHCVRAGHDISGVACVLGDDAPRVWDRLRSLRSLAVLGRQVDVGVLALPELRQLTVRSGGLPRRVLADLFRSTLPALADLELWFGRRQYGGTVTMRDLAPLLDGSWPFPPPGVSQARLGLRNAEFGDALCAALPTSAVLPRLSALDLTMGVVTDAGGGALLANADRFAHLQLSVDGWFSDEVLAALRERGFVASRRGPPDDPYKYTAVGE